MSLRILSATNVFQIISELSLHDLLQTTALVFSAFSSNPEAVDAPHRTSILTSNHTSLFMPARLARAESNIQAVGADLGETPKHAIEGTSIKIVSVPSAGDSQAGLPATIVVMDEATGHAKAIINARELTALRTAAGSVLATTLLLPPAKLESGRWNLVVFGSGLQIKYHIDLLVRAYPGLIKRCTIVGRRINERFVALKDEVKSKYPGVEVIVGTSGSDSSRNENEKMQQFSLERTIREAHVICSATPSKQALYPSSWVSPGTHIILVGSYTPSMKEVDDELILRARGRIIVDSREACLIEAGELISAGLGGQDLIELGELIAGRKDSSSTGKGVLVAAEKESVSIFKSVGLGVQDVMIASLVLREAERRGIGTVIEEYD